MSWYWEISQITKEFEKCPIDEKLADYLRNLKIPEMFGNFGNFVDSLNSCHNLMMVYFSEFKTYQIP